MDIDKMYGTIYLGAYTFRRSLTTIAEEQNHTEIKGGGIMEQIMPIWEQWCNSTLPLFILGALGLAGIAGLIVRAIKGKIL